MNLHPHPTPRRVLFALIDGCETLDFAGPLQTLNEANSLLGNSSSAPYQLIYCGPKPRICTAQGLVIAQLCHLPKVDAGDLIFVPGYQIERDVVPRALIKWLREGYASGAQICSVCTGAFALGEAGLLDARVCTTHWKRTVELQQRFPRAVVAQDRLFIEDRPIMTSAGIASGIDMTLALIERDHGPRVAAAVAREMVVYIRRDSSQTQGSIYLEFRAHMNPIVHAVQDYIIANPELRCTLADLVHLTGTSERNLTRAFRQATGISITEFRQRVRLEYAKSLLDNPALTIEDVAAQSGFPDTRHFRRLWKKQHGVSPRKSRRRSDTTEACPA
jgi:transcriptional regulator GlxA family with amidase domain